MFKEDLEELDVLHEEKMNEEFLQSKDLLLLSLDAWTYFVENEPEWLTFVPSLLILKKA